MIKIFTNLNGSHKIKLWHETISGSQVWQLFDPTKAIKLAYEKSQAEPVVKKFSKFTQDAMNRGKERERHIIAHANHELTNLLDTQRHTRGQFKIEIDCCNTAETIYEDVLKISGTPDAIDYKQCILLEAKSTCSKITIHHAIYQIELYMLLWRKRYPKTWQDWKYILVTECVDSLQLSYSFIKRDNAFLDYLEEAIKYFMDSIGKTNEIKG